jgi:hypothetical protein
VGVYADAIAAAREAFDIAASYGFNMELLDIGGWISHRCDTSMSMMHALVQLQ